MDSGLDIAGAVGDHSDESSKVCVYTSCAILCTECVCVCVCVCVCRCGVVVTWKWVWSVVGVAVSLS